jgi:Secretion system C-terminal sorting domain/Bacterial Ig-like domain (group 2)
LIEYNSIFGAQQFCMKRIATIIFTISYLLPALLFCSISSSAQFYRITTLAGNGTASFSGDGGAATAAALNFPVGATVDASGNLYVDNRNYNRIRLLTPVPASIIGASHLCIGSTDTLSDATTGGTWSSANPSVATVSATGVVFGVAAGTDTIFYSFGTNTVNTVITVNPLPFADTIFGTTSLCVGSSVSFTDSISGGTWMLSNNIATDTPTHNIVTGIAEGWDTILYIVTNTCGADTARMAFFVHSLAHAGIISGGSYVCVGTHDTLIDTSIIGTAVWSMANGNATIDSSHIVWGASAGVDTVKLIATNLCNIDSAIFIVTVSPLPISGMVSGSLHVCINALDTLTDSTYLGTGSWSATNTNAALTPAGTDRVAVRGLHAGTDSVKFTVANTCGTTVAHVLLTINPLPVHGTIFGDSTVCVHSSILFGDTTTLGTSAWVLTNSNASLDTVAGRVTGQHAGQDTIKILVSNSCGTDTAWKAFLVNPLATAGTIAGSDSMCEAATEYLADSVLGGVWSVYNPSLVSISDSGEVIGLMAGTDTIYYTVTNMCSTDVAILTLHVLPLPHAGSITGGTTICTGASDTLTASVAGGLWSSANAEVATVMPTGAVTAIAAGMTSVQYKVINSCGVDSTHFALTVNGPAVVSAITSFTGTDSVCVGATITLIDSIAGGVWMSRNPYVLYLNGDSTAMGVAASLYTAMHPGLDTVWYKTTNACGSDSAYTTVSVIGKPPHSIISGLNFVCAGRTADLLTGSISGGTWMAINANASVNTTTGSVTGVISSTGDTILYTTMNGCGTTQDSFFVTIPSAWACDSIAAVPTVNPLADRITVYPNPATGAFTVAFNGQIDAFTAHLVDIYGRIVLIRDIKEPSDKVLFDTADLVAGNYVLIIVADGRTYREKVVIY